MGLIDIPVRAVFDGNVLLQAMANPNGPAGACFSEVRTGMVSVDFISHFNAIDVLTPIQLLRLVRSA